MNKEIVDLSRFISAQEYDYEVALREIKNGRKVSHWMWYIFPQIKGLGFSSTAKYYEIKSIDEAKAYINHEVLGSRLKEISNELLKLDESNPYLIFGDIDAVKLKSCMTLFDYVSNDDVFSKVLNKYYNDEKDDKSLEIINNILKESE